MLYISVYLNIKECAILHRQMIKSFPVYIVFQYEYFISRVLSIKGLLLYSQAFSFKLIVTLNSTHLDRYSIERTIRKLFPVILK